MARTDSKTTKKTSTTTPVVETPVVIKAEKTKTVKDTKKKEVVQVAAVVADTSVSTSDVTDNKELGTNAVTVIKSEIDIQTEDFLTKLNQYIAMGQNLKKTWILLDKTISKERKASQKLCKKKRKNGQKSPSGFSIPVKISDELCTYLGKPFGTQMSRTDATKELNVIFRAQNMQDKENGRNIIPTPDLRKLLRLTSEDRLTYFNLQHFLCPHFEKKGQLLTTSSAPAITASTHA